MEQKKFKHVKIIPHPLKDEWMVFIKDFPSIPPFFGSRKECLKAASFAEKKAEQELLKQKTNENINKHFE